MKEVKVTFKMVTDMMHDRFTEEDELAIAIGKPASKGKKGKPVSEEGILAEAIKRAHINSDDEYIVPNAWLHGCLQEATRFQKVGMMSMQRFGGCITVIGETFNIMRNGKPVKVGDQTIDTRSCNANGGGGQKVKVIKHRIMLHTGTSDPLTITFNLTFDDTKLTDIHIRNLFLDAGQLIGLGSFRPQHKGIYGKFEPLDITGIRQWSPEENCTYSGCFNPEPPKKTEGRAKAPAKKSRKAT